MLPDVWMTYHTFSGKETLGRAAGAETWGPVSPSGELFMRLASGAVVGSSKAVRFASRFRSLVAGACCDPALSIWVKCQ